MKRDEKGRFIRTKTEKHGIQEIISEKYQLSGGYFTVKRDGQEPPSRGNKVVALVTAYLPGDSEEYLNKPIVFENKLEIFHECLYLGWGTCFGDYRIRNKRFTAITWREAFAKAKKYAKQELQKLEDALQERSVTLEAAEY